MSRRTRRAALAAATGALAGFSGCVGAVRTAGRTRTDEPSYERVQATAVYRAEGVGLGLPAGVETVADPAEAGMVLVPDETDVNAETVVRWLSARRVVAIVGANALATWLDWTGTDAYRSRYGDTFGETRPPPRVVVAGAIDGEVTAFRYGTAGGTPTADQVREALETGLASLRPATPDAER